MKNNSRDVRWDAHGYRWRVNKMRSTRYPSGEINVLVLESCSGGARTYVRYDEAGTPIAGDFSLA